MQINLYPIGPCSLCVCLAWKDGKLKSCHAKGTYYFNHTFSSKSPITSRLHQEQLLDSCPNHRFPTLLTQCKFKLSNLADIFHHDPLQNPANLPKGENGQKGGLKSSHCTQVSPIYSTASLIYGKQISHRGPSKTVENNEAKTP